MSAAGNEPPISDELAQWMSASNRKLELTTGESRAAGLELLRHRAMLRRLEALEVALGKYGPERMEHFWAAELHTAITGRAWLYRCPDHGDRKPMSQRHEHGVCCGEAYRDRLGTCSKRAVLVGEVDVP